MVQLGPHGTPHTLGKAPAPRLHHSTCKAPPTSGGEVGVASLAAGPPWVGRATCWLGQGTSCTPLWAGMPAPTTFVGYHLAHKSGAKGTISLRGWCGLGTGSWCGPLTACVCGGGCHPQHGAHGMPLLWMLTHDATQGHH